MLKENFSLLTLTIVVRVAPTKDKYGSLVTGRRSRDALVRRIKEIEVAKDKKVEGETENDMGGDDNN